MCHTSLSARRAWIEILILPLFGSLCWVALRKESVDRNKYVVQCRKTLGVALRKESVDRNYRRFRTVQHTQVALRKESVDRNYYRVAKYRRIPVALRKESVDRNKIGITAVDSISKSLSARRAWIEIPLCRLN